MAAANRRQFTPNPGYMLGGYPVMQANDSYFEGSESKVPKKHDGEGNRRKSPNKAHD